MATAQDWEYALMTQVQGVRGGWPTSTAAMLLELRDRIAALREELTMAEERWRKGGTDELRRIAALETATKELMQHWHADTSHNYGAPMEVSGFPSALEKAQPQEEPAAGEVEQGNVQYWRGWKAGFDQAMNEIKQQTFLRITQVESLPVDRLATGMVMRARVV